MLEKTRVSIKKYTGFNPCEIEKYIFLMMVNNASFCGYRWKCTLGPMMMGIKPEDVASLKRDAEYGGVPHLYGLSYRMYHISHQVFGNVCTTMFISNLIDNYFMINLMMTIIFNGVYLRNSNFSPVAKTRGKCVSSCDF